jgi:hypothetical protein
MFAVCAEVGWQLGWPTNATSRRRTGKKSAHLDLSKEHINMDGKICTTPTHAD